MSLHYLVKWLATFFGSAGPAALSFAPPYLQSTDWQSRYRLKFRRTPNSQFINHYWQ